MFQKLKDYNYFQPSILITLTFVILIIPPIVYVKTINLFTKNEKNRELRRLKSDLKKEDEIRSKEYLYNQITDGKLLKSAQAIAILYSKITDDENHEVWVENCTATLISNKVGAGSDLLVSSGGCTPDEKWKNHTEFKLIFNRGLSNEYIREDINLHINPKDKIVNYKDRSDRRFLDTYFSTSNGNLVFLKLSKPIPYSIINPLQILDKNIKIEDYIKKGNTKVLQVGYGIKFFNGLVENIRYSGKISNKLSFNSIESYSQLHEYNKKVQNLNESCKAGIKWQKNKAIDGRVFPQKNELTLGAPILLQKNGKYFYAGTTTLNNFDEFNPLSVFINIRGFLKTREELFGENNVE